MTAARAVTALYLYMCPYILMLLARRRLFVFGLFYRSVCARRESGVRVCVFVFVCVCARARARARRDTVCVITCFHCGDPSALQWPANTFSLSVTSARGVLQHPYCGPFHVR
jgi:hypothetical protein